MKSVFKYFLFSLLLIAIDQAIKYWVYKHMLPGYQGQINIHLLALSVRNLSRQLLPGSIRLCC